MFRSETLSAFAELQKAVSDEIDFNKTSGDEFSQQASSASSTGRFWTWAILLLAVVCGSVLAFFIVRSVTKVLVQSVSELSEGAEQVASAASQVSSFQPVAGPGLLRAGGVARRDFGLHRRDQLHGPQEHGEQPDSLR